MLIKNLHGAKNMLILSLVLIYIGFYLLYGIKQKKFKAWQFKIVASVVFISACILLMHHYGIGVGFVSTWIFASPIVFGLILKQNNISHKKNNPHNSHD